MHTTRPIYRKALLANLLDLAGSQKVESRNTRFLDRLPISFLNPWCDGKLARPINGHKEIQVAFGCLGLGNIDVKKSRWDNV